jgi:hypothetical protein
MPTQDRPTCLLTELQDVFPDIFPRPEPDPDDLVRRLVERGREVPTCHHGPNTYCNHKAEWLVRETLREVQR